jgi:hypothetical protein
MDAAVEHTASRGSGKRSAAAADDDAAAAPSVIPAAAGRPPSGRLPRVLALADSILFLWCGRIVREVKRKGHLDVGDAAAALPRGARGDIDAQVC